MARVYVLLENDVEIAQGTIKEIAAKTGIKESSLYGFKYNPSKKRVSKRLASVDLGDGEWTLYEGDELIAIDTLRNLAKMRGVTEKTIRFYSYPCNQKRGEVCAERMANKKKYEVIEKE